MSKYKLNQLNFFLKKSEHAREETKAYLQCSSTTSDRIIDRIKRINQIRINRISTLIMSTDVLCFCVIHICVQRLIHFK